MDNTQDAIHPRIPLPDTPQNHQTAMQDFEKQLILPTLEQNNWHREKAAQSLKISRRTFFRKLKNLGKIMA